jgi:hypothetical protein
MGFPKREDCASALINTRDVFKDLSDDKQCTDQTLRTKLLEVSEAADEAEKSAHDYVDKNGKQRHNDIADTELDKVIAVLETVAALVDLGDDEAVVSEDVPQHFPVIELPDLVDALAADVTGRDLAQFVDSLNLRIRGLFTRGPLASVLDPGDAESITLDQWLNDHIGADQAANGPVAIVDLSLVPSEVIHIVVAVLARMVFEAVQRYRRAQGEELPTVLVLEEAHTFVHRDLIAEGAPPAGRACGRTFERIAREGRKFGLGLVLASQRPSEMSATVLSQCNTFLLHRLVNDRDQDLVRRLVPDALGDLLTELPSLPSRRGILLGWGAPAPVLVEVRELPEDHRPHSPDPDFWDVWTGKKERSVDWKAIADAWVGADEPKDSSEKKPGEPG